MFGAGADPSDICKGLKGTTLAYCKEQAANCEAQKSGAGPGNPYKLKTCAGDVFTFSDLAGCLGNVPRIIEQRGSCPSPAAVEQATYASPDDTGECDKYTGKKKDYCLEQIGVCLDYKDKFSAETPISLETCNHGHFNFSSLYYCFYGVHVMIEQIGVCPGKKKPPPAPAPPAPTAVPEPAAPELKESIILLTTSNVLNELYGSMTIVVTDLLDSEEVIRDLNQLKPPRASNPSDPRNEGRIAVIDAGTEDGGALLRALGLPPPAAGKRYVKWPYQGDRRIELKLNAGALGRAEYRDMSVPERIKNYGTRPDEFGIVYVTKDNFSTQFGKGKGPAIVITGDPATVGAEAVRKKIGALSSDAVFSGVFPRIIWIPTHNDDGVKLVEAIGATVSVGGLPAYFYASEEKGRWKSIPYLEPVIITTARNAEDHVRGVAENVLLVVGADEGEGADESEALERELFGAQARGELKLKGKKIDRLALISIKDVPAVFSDGSSSSVGLVEGLRKSSSLPHAFLFSSDFGRRPQWISPQELPGDITPRARPNMLPDTGKKPSNTYREIQFDNYRSVFKDKFSMDVVVVHSLADKKAVDFVNSIYSAVASLPRDFLSPDPDPVAVINWSNPQGRKVARFLGLTPPSPGARYSRFNLVGRFGADGYFEGSRRRVPGDFFASGELTGFYGHRPDGWGFIHVDGGNFAEYFKAGLKEAIVVVGSSPNRESAEIAEQLTEERDALALKTPYIWISPDSAGTGELLKRLSINRGKDETRTLVFRVRSDGGGASWRAVSYTPVVTIENEADVNHWLDTTPERVLVIVGKQTGFGADKADKLVKAVMEANRDGTPLVGTKNVDRVVVIRDFSHVYDRLFELDMALVGRNFVRQVTENTHRVQAYVLSGNADSQKFETVPLNLLPGGVKPADVDADGKAFPPPGTGVNFAVFDSRKKKDMAKIKKIPPGIIMVTVGNDTTIHERLGPLRSAGDRDEINCTVYGIKTAGDWSAFGAKDLFHSADGKALQGTKTYTCQRKDKDTSWTCVEY